MQVLGSQMNNNIEFGQTVKVLLSHDLENNF